MNKSRLQLIQLDWLFILALFAIIGLGGMTLASASWGRFLVQARWFALGIFAMLITLAIGYPTLVRMAYSLYGAVIGLLLLVLFLPARRGAHSWIDLPMVNFSIQPSELAKAALVLVLARHLMNKESQSTLKGIIWPLFLTLLPTALILKQPDLGTAMLFCPAAFAVLYAAGSRRRHLYGLTALGAAALVPMWMFLLKDYQKNRVLAFLHPDRYESREAYQLIMSKIAIGSGGVFGSGWGKGLCNTLGLLPDRHTDFIFVVLAEEGGFAFAALLILVYMVLVLCGLLAAASTRDPAGRLVGVGAASIIGVQTFINISVVTGIMPTTGITLPLISYGGSSMVATFVLIGLILSVGAHRPLVLHGESFTGSSD